MGVGWNTTRLEKTQKNANIGYLDYNDDFEGVRV